MLSFIFVLFSDLLISIFEIAYCGIVRRTFVLMNAMIYIWKPVSKDVSHE